MILLPESHLSWPITYFNYMSIFKPWSNVRLIISQWTLRGFTISTPSLVCFVIFWIKTCFLLNSQSFPTTCWKMFWIFFIVCKRCRLHGSLDNCLFKATLQPSYHRNICTRQFYLTILSTASASFFLYSCQIDQPL